MIQNWDIVSRIDPQTKSLLYALVIDGTEHDARLIAKKLAGYAQAPTAAVAPFVYQFELPSDMDEGTLDKIRTAVTEGISQTNKVNQFVPGGVLGEPLFNQDVTKEDKDFPTFITLDPSESFFRPSETGENSVGRVAAGRGSIDLDMPTGIDLQKQVISTQTDNTPDEAQPAPQPQVPPQGTAPAEPEVVAVRPTAAVNAAEATPSTETGNPINDKDMLIKDMEGTLLDQMPLDDIFEAKTKYDMFLDLNDPKINQQANAGRNAKLADLADGKDSLEETFNIFEQKIKDETCFMDLDEHGHITMRAPVPAQPEQTPAAQTPRVAPAPAAEVKEPQVPAKPAPTSTENTVPDAVSAPAAEARETAPAQEDSLKIQIRTPQAQEDSSALQTPKVAPNEPDTLQLSNHNGAIDPLPVGQTGEPAQMEPEAEEDAAQMPEELKILNTVSPMAGVSVRHFDATEHPAENPDSDLPEITIRERVDVLDKTFNLETTINKETIQRTFQHSLNTQSPEKARPLRTETTAMREMRLRQEARLNEGLTPQAPQIQEPQANTFTAKAQHPAVPTAPEEKSASLSAMPPVAPALAATPEPATQPAALQTAPTAPAPMPQPEEPVPPAAQEVALPKHQTFRIKLKKPLEQTQASANDDLYLQNDKKAESVMQENNEAKLTFRIRRKEPLTQPHAPVQPAAPQVAQAPVQAPHQPHVPTTPAQPAVRPTPAPQPSVHPAPMQQAAPAPKPAPAQVSALGPNSTGAKIEKTKTIDHSIELPLSELKKHNWPLEVPLVPTFTLDNMVISVNRFAHATTVSVIDSPGKLYNPLVLFGPTGTGKTHFLNAIGYAMSQKLGQENIFMTNGVRLSRGIQRYVMEGNIDKFEKFMDSVKVLLIDDIHLIAVNEQNRVHISNLLNKFLKAQKQIVITSKYPPESLAKLEELINFKLDSGWISELKSAHGPAHFKIVKKMLTDNGIDLTDSQVEAFFGAPNMTLSTVSRSIRRIKVLEQVIFPGLEGVDRSQAMILEKLLATKGEDQNSAIMKRSPDEITSLPPFGKGEWGRIGFFYPQNSSNMMNWMVYALSERAKELGIEGSFEIAVRSSYATENIISSAFKIANLCDNKKLKGAVILGPSLQVCDPSVRENFYDILTHMLEVMLIRCGIINMEDAGLPSTYVKLISELLR